MTRATTTNVVGIGGGHGLAATLQAVARYATGDVCGVVSVADNGGSSGRLRHSLGIPPPGDLRRCLVALASDGDGDGDGDDDAAKSWALAFEHRFPDDAGELAGHAFGNLIIAGLTSALGTFDAALEQAGRLLKARGRVLPATVDGVTLRARAGTRTIDGQVDIDEAGPLSELWIEPRDARAPHAVIEAIERADQIVIGPGSLYSSVLAVLIVDDIRAALARTKATKVYVANLRPVAGAAGFDVGAHEGVLHAHGVVPDVVVADPSEINLGRVEANVVTARLARSDGAAHDPVRLAELLSALL